MVAVLLPVKDPEQAKRRLSGFLSPQERMELAWAMLADVAAALSETRLAQRIVVVTNAPSVVSFARRRGWEILVEDRQESESASVDWASARLVREGVRKVLRLPGDIPLVAPSDIDDLLGIEASAPFGVIVPSVDGAGTNALVRCPPDAFCSRFGPDSFRRHQQEADRTGTALHEVLNDRIALDIDRPYDLASLLERASVGRTVRLLQCLQVGRRLRVKNGPA